MTEPRPRVRRKGSVRFPFLLAAALTTIIWPAALLAADQGGDSSPRGAVYRRPLGNDPATLDPPRISDIYSRSVSQQIFDGLVRFDHSLAVVPGLAQFWKASRDGRVWTFTLRQGVTFHHGRELTADDVIYSLTRIVDPAVKSGAADLFSTIEGARDFREGRASRISGLKALDRYTVQVTLDQPRVPFVSLLAVGHAKIVPEDVVQRQGETFGTHPIGTGPFKFLHWKRGEEIVLAANPDYFDGPPRLSRIVYRIFPGEQTAAMLEEFEQGRLEDSPIPMSAYRRVRKSAKDAWTYVKRPMISVRFYGFNTRVKPLDDRRVRQAFIHAIDREALIEELTLGRFVLARGVLPPGTLGFNPKLEGYAYDPERARGLLRDAGYADGKGLPTIEIWSSVRLDREFGRIKASLGAVGIPVRFRYLTDWPAFSKALAEGRFPVFLYAWFADVPDPDNFLFELFHSESARNFFGYVNREVDTLLEVGRSTADPRRRVDLYRRAEQMIMDDAPLVPIFHYTYERLFQPYVRSIEVNGLGDPYIPLRKIWLDRRE